MRLQESGQKAGKCDQSNDRKTFFEFFIFGDITVYPEGKIFLQTKLDMDTFSWYIKPYQQKGVYENCQFRSLHIGPQLR